MTTAGADTAFPVGFIGLGNMGAPIAQRFVSWPGGLVVCDARPEATEKVVAAGATAAVSYTHLTLPTKRIV